MGARRGGCRRNGDEKYTRERACLFGVAIEFLHLGGQAGLGPHCGAPGWPGLRGRQGPHGARSSDTRRAAAASSCASSSTARSWASWSSYVLSSWKPMSTSPKSLKRPPEPSSSSTTTSVAAAAAVGPCMERSSGVSEAVVQLEERRHAPSAGCGESQRGVLELELCSVSSDLQAGVWGSQTGRWRPAAACHYMQARPLTVCSSAPRLAPCTHLVRCSRPEVLPRLLPEARCSDCCRISSNLLRVCRVVCTEGRAGGRGLQPP